MSPTAARGWGFFRLRQLRRVRRSIDRESAATLVHAFITSRIDYCNAVFASVLKSLTDKFLRVLNAAVRVVSGTKKFDRGLTHLMHAQLYWLDVSDGDSYQIATMVPVYSWPGPAVLGSWSITVHWSPTSPPLHHLR